MRRGVMLAAGLLVVLFTPAWLVGGDPGTPGPGGSAWPPPWIPPEMRRSPRAFLQMLYPPELIMQHQQAIGLI